MVGDEVPFVEADDERPALAARRGRRCVRSCFSNGIVASSSTTTTSAKRTARSASATDELFQLVLDAGALAQARRVEELDCASAPVPVDRDRVAGDAGLGAGQQAVLAEDAVDQRRLAGVGPPDDRRSAAASCRRLVCRPPSARRSSSVSARRRQGVGAPRRGRARPSPCSAESGTGSPRPSPKPRRRPPAGPALGLVGDEDHRLAGAAHQLGEELVGRQSARRARRSRTGSTSASAMAASVCARMRPGERALVAPPRGRRCR